MDKIEIANIAIGPKFPPFTVAEMSGNHNQSLKRALEIVDAAADVGVHAVKIQTYSADTMTLNISDREFVIRDPNSLWNGRTLYDLYRDASTSWDWHEAIFSRCKKRGLICFSTPFDETAVDFLEKLRVPCYKIASFENVDLPLISRVAATGKPIFISTGMASETEIAEAVSTARQAGASEIVLLKCTSSYPCRPDEINALTIPDLRSRFSAMVGLSDHTMGIGVAIASVALGACVIEKHFTLKRDEGGVDSAFSMEPAEMKSLVSETKRAWLALGKVHYGQTEGEKTSLIFRRSLYAVQNINAGECLTSQNIKAIRPGFGLPPKFFDSIVGKKINRWIPKGTPLKLEYLEPAGKKVST